MKICPKCGSKNGNNHRHCYNCGEKLFDDNKSFIEDDKTMSLDEYQPQKKRILNKGLIAAVGMVVLIGAGIVLLKCFPAFFTKDESEDTTQILEDSGSVVDKLAWKTELGKTQINGINDSWWLPDRISMLDENGNSFDSFIFDNFTFESSDETILSIETNSERQLVSFIPHKRGKAEVRFSYRNNDGTVTSNTQIIDVVNKPLMGSVFLIKGNSSVVISPNGTANYRGQIYYGVDQGWDEIWVYEDSGIGIAVENIQTAAIDNRSDQLSVDLKDVLNKKTTGKLWFVLIKKDKNGKNIPLTVKEVNVEIR